MNRKRMRIGDGFILAGRPVRRCGQM